MKLTFRKGTVIGLLFSSIVILILTFHNIHTAASNNREFGEGIYRIEESRNLIESSEEDWMLEGEGAFNRFGYSARSAGDVNNDGYDDVIVGAYLSSSSRGKAYLYFGGSSGPSSTPSWVSSGESLSSNFGVSVSTALDVNNDGFDDILVGASGYNSNTGKAYLYLGRNGVPLNVPSWTFTGESDDSYLAAISSAGDVNNDGYNDVIVGAPGFDNFTGKAYLFLGSSSGLSTTPAWTKAGEGTGNYFGFCVTRADDVNNDGYDDVLISTDGFNGNLSKAYIFHGNPSGLSSTPAWTDSDNSGSYGYSVSSAGDLNKDGYDDIVVGDLEYLASSGAAYVYLGGSSGISINPNIVLSGETFGSEFGYSVSGIGDINSDGFDDIAIGADGYSYEAGAVYVYYGNSHGIDSVQSAFILGTFDSRFGSNVAGCGDVNGDGFDDLLGAGYQYETDRGNVRIFRGSACGVVKYNWIRAGTRDSERFGYDLNMAGDVNGDGLNDLIIGGYGFSGNKGKAYLFLGDTCRPGLMESWSAEGSSTNDLFGTHVNTAGDVNNDGFDEIIVGASGVNSSKGKVYLYQGSQIGPSPNETWSFDGEAAMSFLAASSYAGDVNNDGFDDIIVGSPGYDGFRGKVYLFNGSSTGPVTTPSWTATGESTGNYFGHCVSEAGDVNGDGYDDVLVSTDGYNGNMSKAYVYHGGPQGLSQNPDWTGSDNIQGSVYGYSSSTAGDVNGDGFDDIIIGALGYSASMGKAYLYLGSPSGLSLQPAWSKEGEQEGDEFGYSVNFAGDLNGDGRSEVIIGADGYQTQTGKVYIFSGQLSGLSNLPAWIKTGTDIFERYGASVAYIGDTDGDGADEIGIGAYRFANYRGKAELISGRDIVVSVQSPSTNVPASVVLHQNYPNPFNPSTRISFELSKSSNIRIDVFDISGKFVGTIAEGFFNAGIHNADFISAGLPGGVYFCRLNRDGKFDSVIKMILLK